MFNPVELIHYIACSLVRNPEHVKVDEIPGNDETVIELRVLDSDISSIIGKRGSIIRSLRTMLRACSDREKNYVLELVE